MTEPREVPGYYSFGQLSAKDSIFDSIESAIEWLNEHGRTVLKEDAMEIIKNLLTANAPERRARGQIGLERAIKAQVAWLEMFHVWTRLGKFAQLKELTDAVRDSELPNAEHMKACKELNEAHVNLVIKSEEGEEAIGKIRDHLKEEAFIESILAKGRLVDKRPKVKDPNWAVKVLTKVQNGKGGSVPPKTLTAVASSLDYWSKKFFGEDTK